MLLIMGLFSSPISFANDYVISTSINHNKSSTPIPEISEEERIANETADILSRADISGSYTGKENLDNKYGGIWIGSNYIAGITPVPSKFDWTLVVVTTSGQYIVGTSFRDNAWTNNDSYGPAISYLNGVSVQTMTNAPLAFEDAAGPSLTIRRTWNGTSKGYSILGKYYIFKNRDFPINRKWK